MRIIPLSEGAFTVDKTKQFIPFNTSNDQLNERPVGSLLVEIQPFVIVTAKDIVLLDTGLGFAGKDGVLLIHQNLRNNGIDPLQVTKVLLSHLHKDHSGGISKVDEVLRKRVINFPNATYYVNKQEFKHALSAGYPSYITEDYKILTEYSNVKFIEESGLIDNYIRYQVTAGHTLFHQVFWILDEGKTIFFGGDDAPQLQQMKSRFIAKYDYDGKKSMELRRQWWQQGKLEKWIFLFYHDIKTPLLEF